MTKKEKYLVALDVGSTKTCAIISELTETGAKFVAMGAAESKGLRKGLIANIGAAATSVRRAIEEAEGVAGVPVERVIAGVAGSHLRGVNSRGGITVGHRAMCSGQPLGWPARSKLRSPRRRFDRVPA